MTLPTLPANPSRGQPQDEFDTKLDAWIASLGAWTAAVNALSLYSSNGGTMQNPTITGTVSGTGATWNMGAASATTLSATTGAAVGGATPGSGGLAFPATAVSVANPNTLADYEIAGWTPVLAFGGASVGITYDTNPQQFAHCTKNGNRCLFSMTLPLTNKGSSTGAATISLPFASYAGNNGSYSAVSITALGLTGISGMVQGYIAPGGTTIVLSYTGTGAHASLLDSNFTNSSMFIVSGQYLVEV